jgi:CelD/BcsL family acetyltransferase involved in cellulose biosynthesis
MSDLARSQKKAAELSAAVLSVEDASPLWTGFSDTDPFGVAQMLPWVRGWKDCVNSDVFVAVLQHGDETVLLLPLEIVRSYGILTARYVGGSHANANFPLLKSEAAPKITMDGVQSLLAAVKAAFPAIDALVLTRQLQDFDGIANPLLCLGSSESPNLSLSFELAPDFEALAKNRGWSRKQKKMRNQARRLEMRGGWTCVKSDTPETALQLIDRFFLLKAARFREFGQRNTFEAENVRTFFRALFMDAAGSSDPQFQLDGLSVNGELLAVSGSAFRHGAVVVEFGAVDGAETALSPGDFLYHQMIKRSCVEGRKHFSFGVGDEPYKRSWCDIETHHHDSAHAFSAKGQLYVAAFRSAAAAKRAIKRNAFLFAMVKKWRERKAEKPAKAEADPGS